jgi:excinuclease ABC subunit A
MDIIKVADYIIDLGPDGGDRGGQVVAAGTPEQILQEQRSYTGQFLERYFRENHLSAGLAESANIR